MSSPLPSPRLPRFRIGTCMSLCIVLWWIWLFIQVIIKGTHFAEELFQRLTIALTSSQTALSDLLTLTYSLWEAIGLWIHVLAPFIKDVIELLSTYVLPYILPFLEGYILPFVQGILLPSFLALHRDVQFSLVWVPCMFFLSRWKYPVCLNACYLPLVLWIWGLLTTYVPPIYHSVPLWLACCALPTGLSIRCVSRRVGVNKEYRSLLSYWTLFPVLRWVYFSMSTPPLVVPCLSVVVGYLLLVFQDGLVVCLEVSRSIVWRLCGEQTYSILLGVVSKGRVILGQHGGIGRVIGSISKVYYYITMGSSTANYVYKMGALVGAGIVGMYYAYSVRIRYGEMW